MEKFLIATLLTVLSGFASSKEISMVCTWELFSNAGLVEKDTFIFNIENETVYWVDENQRIKFDDLNEGRIVFTGIPKSRVVDEYKPLTFSLNRVTGELNIAGEYEPYGLNNKCRKKIKIL